MVFALQHGLDFTVSFCLSECIFRISFRDLLYPPVGQCESAGNIESDISDDKVGGKYINAALTGSSLEKDGEEYRSIDKILKKSRVLQRVLHEIKEQYKDI